MEQGFGDIIMYARFLPFLKVMGAAKVVVLAVPPIVPLLSQIECIDQFTDMVEAGPGHECDYWIGSMSLPYYIDCSPKYAKSLFPIGKDKVVSSEGYLDAIPSGIERKIGVNWGASKGALRWIKSISEEEMMKLVGDDAYSLNPEADGFFRPLPDDEIGRAHV